MHEPMSRLILFLAVRTLVLCTYSYAGFEGLRKTENHQSSIFLKQLHGFLICVSYATNSHTRNTVREMTGDVLSAFLSSALYFVHFL